MSDLAERRVGSIIGGKWRVDALLGAGSMAAVYAVTHRNGARAALKILHPTLCADAQVCERFLGEGYLTNSVKHHGIVRVLDDGATDDGCVFLVMDLLEGMTLEEARQQRENGRFDLPEMLVIADRLMDVLAAVHAVGIIHRDLKPQNIYLCDDGVVKLLDFGVARLSERDSQSQLSSFGLVLGTPSFMSPEQAQGARDQIDHRTDIWSLGASIFTSLTGQTVHLGPNIQAKLLAAATAKARSIAMARHDLPAPICNVIDMSLRFKREDRWQSVAAFRHAMRETAFELGILERTDLEPESYEVPAEDPGAMEPDNAERALAMMVRRNAGSKSRPPGRPASNRPPAATSTAPLNRPLQSTLFGLGGPAAQALQQPPAPRFDPANVGTERLVAVNALNGEHASLAPTPSTPLGPSVVPAVQYPAAPRGSFASLPGHDPDGWMEGSVPGASSTLLNQVSRPKKSSSAGLWIAGVVLVAGAAAAAAFFVVNRRPSDGGVSTTAPSLTSATPVLSAAPSVSAAPSAAPGDPSPAPSASFTVLTAPDLELDVTPAASGSARPGRPGMRPGRFPVGVPAPGGKVPPAASGSATPEPSSTAAAPPPTAAPPPAPTAPASGSTLAPDPFGTPE